MKNYLVSTSDTQGVKMSIFAHLQQKFLTRSGLLAYRFPAAPHWVAGCRNPSKHMATPDAESVFFCVAISVPAANGRTVSMVALVGQLSGWPVSLCAGIPTPISVTTHQECRNSGGDSFNLHEEISAMLTTPTPTQTQFKFLFLAVSRANLHDIPHSESVTACTEREARQTLSRDYVLILAGRLPLEARHV